MTHRTATSLIFIAVLYFSHTAEGQCGDVICGIGTNCDRGTCSCLMAEGYVDLQSPTNEHRFCSKVCTDEKDNTTCVSLTNTACRDIDSTEYTAFRCKCIGGYGRSPYGNCTDINECDQNDTACGDNSTCQNEPGTYSCSCRDGYERVGPSTRESECTDINECGLSTYTCGQNAACDNVPGTYSCHCLSGFNQTISNPLQPSCVNVNECDLQTDICGENSTCKDDPGSYTCPCYHGYERLNSSLNMSACSDIDECTEGSLNDCESTYQCVNHPAGYACVCPQNTICTTPPKLGTTSMASIIGSAAGGGGALLVIILVIVVVCIYRKKGKQDEKKPSKIGKANEGMDVKDLSQELDCVASDGDVRVERKVAQNPPPAVQKKPETRQKNRNQTTTAYESVHGLESFSSGEGGVLLLDQTAESKGAKKSKETIYTIDETDKSSLYSKVDRSWPNTKLGKPKEGTKDEHNPPTGIIYSEPDGAAAPGQLKIKKGSQGLAMYDHLNRQVIKPGTTVL